MKVTTHTTKEDEVDKTNSVEDLKELAKSYQKRAKRLKLQRKLLLWILFLIFYTGLIFGLAHITTGALTDWFIQQTPTIYVKRAQAAELKQSEKPKAYTIPQIVDAVHILESSGGVKDGCIAKGKINGFGFAQHGSGDVWNCYKNYAQVRALVEQWFAQKVPAMGLPTALCYYNTGYKKADCPYYQNFLQVVKSQHERNN